MRGLLTLVAKEWKDVRALTAASAVLVVAACLAVRWYLEERHGLSMADFPSTPRHLEIFVPACAALYATLIAADCVGGEVASRRIDLTALLPAGRMRVWTAKALFLLVASAAFTVWCAVVQTGVLAAIDGRQFTDPFLGQVLGSPWVLGLVATFAGSTLLVSTTGLRGLAAALVGGAVATALLVAMHGFLAFLGYPAVVHTVERYEPSYRESIAALWLPPAVLVAAGLAYCCGRVHLGKVLRPAAIAVGVIVAALAAPGAALAYDALAVVPGGHGVTLWIARPSPDGRHVALPFRKERPVGAEKVFVLDVERGVLVEPECGNCGVDITPGTWDGVWEADGKLRVVRYVGAGVERSRIDPATGAVLSTESLDMDAYSETLRKRTEPWNESVRWRSVVNRRQEDGGPTFLVKLSDGQSSDHREFRSWAPAGVPFPFRRLVYFPEPCVLAVRGIPDGEERRVLTSREPWQGGPGEIGDLTPDGRALLVRHDGVWKSLDLESGATTEVPRSVARPRWWCYFGGASKRIVVVYDPRDSEKARLVDLESGVGVDVPGQDFGSPHPLEDGRFVVLRNGGVLDLVGRDLRVVRRLWPLGKE